MDRKLLCRNNVLEETRQNDAGYHSPKRSQQSGGHSIGNALEGEYLDDVPLPHADCPRHSDLRRPRRRKKDEYKENEKQPDNDGDRPEHREERYKLAACLLGQFQPVGLHIVDGQPEEFEIQGVEPLSLLDKSSTTQNSDQGRRELPVRYQRYEPVRHRSSIEFRPKHRNVVLQVAGGILPFDSKIIEREGPRITENTVDLLRRLPVREAKTKVAGYLIGKIEAAL